MSNMNENVIGLESVNLTINEEGMTIDSDVFYNASGNVDMSLESDECIHISLVDTNTLHRMTNDDCSEMLHFLYQFEDSDFMLNYLDWSQTFWTTIRNNNYAVDSLMEHLLAGGSI